MIDTRRAHQMTKMAMFEEKESESIRAASNHSKKDYVGFWTVIYAVSAVMFYLLYCVVGISLMIAVHTRGVPTIAWIVFAVLATSGFVFHTYFYVKSGKKKASDRYDEGKKKSDYMTEQYSVLDDMYNIGSSN